MACHVDNFQDLEPEPNAQNAPVPAAPPQQEYDFIEQPSQDFFCPVTLELLTEPHQTTCCGNHLSQEAANRLRQDGKPCPMCKDPQLGTMPDKYMKRRVNNLKVCCPYKKSGCEWEGEVSTIDNHTKACPKHPWQCQYCPFASTYDIGLSKHIPKCTQYPVMCPNSCEIGTVPRCEVEAHLMVCPLEPVACEYAELGCDVKVPQRDLTHHMKEGQQQHLLSATLLNLRLTRENLVEKDRVIADMRHQITEKEHQLKEKEHRLKENEHVIAERDRQIIELQQQLKAQQEELVEKVSSLQTCLDGLDLKIVKSSEARHNLYMSQGFTCHEFVVEGFSKIKSKNADWCGEKFYSHPGGYALKIRVQPNGEDKVKGTHVSVQPGICRCENEDKLDWPVECTLHVVVINQLGDYGHHVTSASRRLGRRYIYVSGVIPQLISHKDLVYNAKSNTQYLKDDCLKLQVYVKFKL